jgi:hypothetical protein
MKISILLVTLLAAVIGQQLSPDDKGAESG